MTWTLEDELDKLKSTKDGMVAAKGGKYDLAPMVTFVRAGEPLLHVMVSGGPREVATTLHAGFAGLACDSATGFIEAYFREVSKEDEPEVFDDLRENAREGTLKERLADGDVKVVDATIAFEVKRGQKPDEVEIRTLQHGYGDDGSLIWKDLERIPGTSEGEGTIRDGRLPEWFAQASQADDVCKRMGKDAFAQFGRTGDGDLVLARIKAFIAALASSGFLMAVMGGPRVQRAVEELGLAGDEIKPPDTEE